MAEVSCSLAFVERTSITIGMSMKGRPIQAMIVGSPDAQARILVVAGQHGDEPLAIEVVEALADDWQPAPGQALAFVSCINPDGRVANQRDNAMGIDLNRDHQFLRSWECQTLHTFARSFAPQLLIDVHTFRPRRKVLLQSGLEWGADIMMEIDNHPGRLLEYPQRWSTLMSPVMERLEADGVRCDRYLLVQPSGRIRTSSADLVDARNGLSSRIGATGVLIEGREPSRRYGSKSRTRVSLDHAVRSLIGQWFQVGPMMEAPQPVLHLDAQRIRRPPAMAYTLVDQEAVPQRRTIPGRSFVELTPTRPVVLPMAYGIPKDRVALEVLLARHGFEPADEAELNRIGAEQVGLVYAGRPSKRPDRATRRLSVKWHTQVPNPRDRLYYFTDQPGGDRLAALLEPGSRFGLHRYDELEIGLTVGQPYDVVRALRKT